MTMRFAKGLCLLTLMAMAPGCVTPGMTIRGQSHESPTTATVVSTENFGPIAAESSTWVDPNAPVQPQVPIHPASFAQAGACPTGDCQNGPPMYYGPSQCQQCDSGACAGQCQTGCNLPFHPVHRNFHTYSAPRNLVYPQQNTPAAMVQYPYYTFKGPSDFFMK